MNKFTITSDKASSFDPGAQRVTSNPDGSTTTESGAYIDNASIESAVSRATQAMPKAVK